MMRAKTFQNERGSILVITLGFILIFTSLGIASMYMATRENETADLRKFSDQALWLADAGVRRSLQKLPSTMLDESNNAGDSIVQSMAADNMTATYAIDTNKHCCEWSGSTCTSECKHKWDVESEAAVNGEDRGILANIGRYKIDTVLMTKGPIKNFASCAGGGMGSVEILPDCSYAEENVTDLSFETIFNGLHYSDVVPSQVDQTIVDPTNKVDINGGLTLITLQTKKSVNITNNSSASGFVIIDVSGVNNPDVSIEGGSFKGIVWIVAGNEKVKITGNPDFQGSVFVQSTAETTVLGNSDFLYDEKEIDDAVDQFGGVFTNFHKRIVSWQEI